MEGKLGKCNLACAWEGFVNIQRLLWLLVLLVLRICLISLPCVEHIIQGRQPIWLLHPVPSLRFLGGMQSRSEGWMRHLLNYRHVNREGKLSTFPTHLVTVEQAQDKHKENSTGKRKGWKTRQSLVHRFWSSIKQAFLRLSNLEVEEILCLALILLSERNFLDHCSAQPLAFLLGSSFSSISLYMHIRHRLWWECLFWECV